MSRTHKPSSMSRRDFLKATGLAAAGLSIGSALSLGQRPLTVSAQGTTVLDLYHDKASWADNADKVGEAAGKAINIGFKSVPFPDTTTYQSTVRAALGSNKAPDLFTWWSGYRMEDIIKANGAEDLSAIWKKYLDSGEYSKGIADAYTFNGKVYAVPFNVAYWIVFYNTSVFEKNSLTPPKTWDDFTKLCDALKAKGITPMAQTIADRWQSFIIFEELVARTAGPDFWNNLMAGKAAYDDAKVADALAMWKDMMAKGYFTDPGIAMGTAENGMGPLFKQGKVAMLPVGDWYAASLVGIGMKPGTDYNAFIMPNPKADVPNLLFFETGPLLVSAKGARKEQALKVADWWMSADAQTMWDGLMGFSPANAKAQIDNPVSKNVAKQIADGKFQALQRYWEATPPDIVETAVDELGKFILKPDAAKEVLGAIQKKAEAVWKSRG